MQNRYNKRQIGSHYEHLAAEYLKQRGVEILEQNYQTRYGEIDLIARDGRYLVFIEVKFRTKATKGNPAEAVDFRKQQRIRNAARYYLYKHRYGEDTPCRFDVIGILGNEIQWIKNAF